MPALTFLHGSASALSPARPPPLKFKTHEALQPLLVTARGVGHAFDSRLAHRVKPNAARHSLGARPDVYARSVKTTVASVLLRPG